MYHLCFKFPPFHSNPKQLQCTEYLVRATCWGFNLCLLLLLFKAPYSCCWRRGVALKGCGYSLISSLLCSQSPLTHAGHNDLSFFSLRAHGPQAWLPHFVRWIRSSYPGRGPRLRPPSVLPHLGLCRVLASHRLRSSCRAWCGVCVGWGEEAPALRRPGWEFPSHVK